jgi:GTPase SAR1 family protein
VTSRESFEALEGWFQQVSNNIDSRVIIMLLGNKCDMPNREVPYNIAMEYARMRNFGFLEVSAKTGMNVRNSFNCLVREIYRNTAAYEEPIKEVTPITDEQKKKRDRIVTGNDLRMSSIGRGAEGMRNKGSMM